MSRRKLYAGQTWWEAEVVRLRVELRWFLTKELPALPNEHEDLLQDTLLDLTREVKERSEVCPASWRREASEIPVEDRVLVKRILRKYGYPPDLQDAAVQMLLQQAEALSTAWAGAA